MAVTIGKNEIKRVSDNIFCAENVDFGAGSNGMEITYGSGSATTTLELHLDTADGVSPGTVACVFKNGVKESNHAAAEIGKVTGIHNIYFIQDGAMPAESITFTEKSPYASAKYAPVPESKIQDIHAEAWEAVDSLGRRIRSCEDVGCKKDKKVGIFYWTWRNFNQGTPVNTSKIIEQFPAAEYNMNHPAWGKNPVCHWNEPLYGYYKNDDPYVIRKHAVFLADAGVDFVMFDCTNGSLVWKESYEPLLEGFRQARQDGIRAPQVAFMLNFAAVPDSLKMLRALYQDLYKPGLYRDLWFMWKGKPLIMAYPDCIPEKGAGAYDTALLKEIREFFTFRAGQPAYSGGPQRPDQWGWLEKFPQNKYCEKPDGSCEMVTVGVGQNSNDKILCTYFNNENTCGRSYTGREGNAKLTKDSYKYGYNVQEQWDRAIDLDPELVFITGWNEWLAGRWVEPWIQDPDSPQIAFVDEFDRERSRDIEFDRDGIKDSYYLQMVSNIRRFKGTGRRPEASGSTTILFDGGFGQWDAVMPEFRNNRGSAVNRDFDGLGECHYKNTTARNDIIAAKVAHDADYIYFYVETSAPLTAPDNPGWMRLFINSDRDRSTGWEGYDYVIDRTMPSGNLENSHIGKMAVEKHVRDFDWAKTGDAEYKVSGNKMQVKVPRAALRMNGRLDFEFKWSDNMQNTDAMDFYENGCAAPVGRFNFRYIEK